PCDSELLSIFTFSRNRNAQAVVVPLTDIKCKCQVFTVIKALLLSHYFITIKMFCVCEVIDEGGKSVEVIPESWLFGKPDSEKRVKCFWPREEPSKVRFQRKKPEQDWKSYAARVLRKYDCYQNARQALPRAEDTSDWSEPDATPKRKRVSVSRRAVDRLEHDSSEDELNHAKGCLKRLPEAPKFVCVQAGNNDATAFQNDEFVSRNDVLFNIEDVREVLSMNQEEGDDHNAEEIGLRLWRRLEKLETLSTAVQASGQSCVDSCLIRILLAVADFQAFDTFLDDDKKEVLVKCELLRDGGGDTTVEFIGRAMKKLMTNEVGLKYSLWGFPKQHKLFEDGSLGSSQRFGSVFQTDQLNRESD
ncbi:hypothetical protein Ocin01_11663, partial [Orchesella cincta]